MSKKIKIVMFIIAVILLLPFFFYNGIETCDATYMQKQQYESCIEITGEFEFSDKIPVSLSYPVYIKKCHVSDGSYVNKGQLLFTLDTETMEKYVKDNSFTHINDSLFSVEEADMLQLSECIYASEAGFVHDISVQNESFALSDEILCTITSEDDVVLKISLSQDDYAKISVGDVVEFSPLIASSQKFSAYICNKTAKIRKDSSLTGSKTVVDVYAKTEQGNPYMINGLQFKGKIITDRIKEINTLPYEYIGQDSDGEYVKIYHGGNIKTEYIKTGIETSDGVQIITDFEDGTLFVVNDFSKGKLLLGYDK